MEENKGQNRERHDLLVSSYVREKTIKLVRVFYIITKGLPEKEPLRYLLREKAVDMMSFIRSVENSSWDVLETMRFYFGEQVPVLENFLDLFVDSGYLGQPSALVLKDELRGLVLYIENSRTTESDPFLGLSPTLSSSSVAPSEASRDLPAVRQARFGTQSTSRTSSGVVAPSLKREQILGFIKEGVEYSIREVVGGVSGYSEKTIQRELSALVSLGILEKKGERRWSTYRKRETRPLP